MCNATSRKIKDICKVRLQMHDETIKDLTNVQYVLGMKKNLILEVLVGKSLRITLVELGLKDTKDAFVVMKSTQKKNLFYLQVIQLWVQYQWLHVVQVQTMIPQDLIHEIGT